MGHSKIVTHYDNLKVARNAPDEVMRAAYRALAQRFHPDKFPDRALAEHRMKIINAAYEALSDPERRLEHDEWIEEQETLIEAATQREHVTEARGHQMGDSPKKQYAEGPINPFWDRKRSTGYEDYSPAHKGGRARSTLAKGVGWLLAISIVVLFIFNDWTRSGPTLPSSKSSSVSMGSAVSFEEASRCFWVYAPIVQVGRDFPHSELFQFGQLRMKWYDTLLKENKANPAIKMEFERGIKLHKQSAIRLQNRLRESLLTRNEGLFFSVIEMAVSCDRILGNQAQSLPRL